MLDFGQDTPSKFTIMSLQLPRLPYQLKFTNITKDEPITILSN